MISIPDPQKIWEAEQAELARQQEEDRQRYEEEAEEFTFIVDRVGDSDLQLDYMSFPEVDMENINEDSSSSESDESEIYNSDNDYSWYRH